MNGFLESLLSEETPPGDDLYGWLLGGWHLDVAYFHAGREQRGLTGEAHFARVLSAGAVQDVWILPPHPARNMPAGTPASRGTTLRLYDPPSQAWRVLWFHPETNTRAELVAKRVGSDIVQIGTRGNLGVPIRWTFSKITSDSFLWTGTSLDPDGTTWNLEAQFEGRRK